MMAGDEWREARENQGNGKRSPPAKPVREEAWLYGTMCRNRIKPSFLNNTFPTTIL